MYNIIDFEDYTNDEEYQLNILKVFSLKEFDESVITSNLDQLYVQIKQHNEFYLLKPLLEKLASRWMVDDLQLGFITLFAYDYFYLTNKLIIEFLNNNEISNNLINDILNKISN